MIVSQAGIYEAARSASPERRAQGNEHDGRGLGDRLVRSAYVLVVLQGVGSQHLETKGRVGGRRRKRRSVAECCSWHLRWLGSPLVEESCFRVVGICEMTGAFKDLGNYEPLAEPSI